MNCVICHSNDIEEMKVNEEIVFKNNIINVPISVPTCKSCGERYYDRKTVQFLENIKKKIKNKKVNLKQTGKVLSITN